LYIAYFVAVGQIMVFRTIAQLINASVTQANNGQESNGLEVAMRVIQVVSIVVTIVAILRVYKFLSVQENSPLSGHWAFAKFLVIKILFLFIIVNQVILLPLISAGIIPIPNWICSLDTICSQRPAAEYCQQRLVQVIFMFEILVVTPPAVALYRHHSLGNSKDLPRPEESLLSRLCYLYYVTLCLPFDLRIFIFGTFETFEATKPDDYELTTT